VTSLSDDVAALDRASERVEGKLVLVGHAYAGAVIGSARNERVKSLVYVAGLAPAQGETVADVFYRATPHPQAPKLAPDGRGLIWLSSDAFATAFAQNATREEHALLSAVQRPISPACISVASSPHRQLWLTSFWRRSMTKLANPRTESARWTGDDTYRAAFNNPAEPPKRFHFQ
jgi:hypothetical protein